MAVGQYWVYSSSLVSSSASSVAVTISSKTKHHCLVRRLYEQ